MTKLAVMIRRIRAFFRPVAAEQEMEEELQHHLALETEANLARGLPPDEAARQARLAFGAVEALREEHRDARGLRWLEDFIGDSRYALRSLRRSPVLAAAAILTLALGIGANTTIFSAVNAVILRPLPFPDADRLVMVWEQNPSKGWYKNVAAPANMLDWRDRVKDFDDVMGYASWDPSFTLTGDGPPAFIPSALVTGNFFSVLGVHAELGRTFTSAETWETGTDVAVISHRLWQTRYSGDPAIVGRSIQISGRSVQVVGVVPAGVSFPEEETDLWMPTAWPAASRGEVPFRRAHWMWAIARLKPRVTPEMAEQELHAVARQLQVEYPATNGSMGAGLTPLHEFLLGSIRGPLLLLLGAVGLLLLIACGNVGNLLLVRAAGLEREVSLRLALGAGRGRLVRQALTESLVLSAWGGAAGILLGWWGTRLLLRLQPAGMLPVREIGISWSVLAFVTLITTLCGLLFGIAPAVWSAGRLPAEVLQEGGRGGSGHRVRRWSDLLVVSEVALALLLTIGAGLLARSFWRLSAVDPGFDGRGVLATRIILPGMRYDTSEKIAGFFDALLREGGALPGVTRSAGTTQLPLTGLRWTSDFTAEGWRPDQVGFEVAHKEVTPDYFLTMGVPVLQGRAFSDADRAGAPPVVMINQALADRYFPGQDPIGRRICFDKVPDSASVWRTIVGVAGNEHQEALQLDPRPEFIAPRAQNGGLGLELLLRTDGDPERLGPEVRALVHRLDPELAILAMTTMDEVRARSVARQRFLLTLLSVFAITGLLLAVVGVYGVIAQMARGRVREMGIRIALGAEPRQVQWLVVRHGLRLIAVGLGVGLAAAFLATRAMASLLYEIAPADPATFVTVPALLVLAGMAASWIPALRASRQDPAGALRLE
ncbi:MAG TPA: ABC transporter permease [Gemmatimonadales bacterium]|nr:ABC transporter permease [Gemmatimonadales bacterium]